MLTYPVVIHKVPTSDFGVTVPDLPGCFSAGDSVEHALAMAREAIELHMEAMIELSNLIPPPRQMESHQARFAESDAIWRWVSVQPPAGARFAPASAKSAAGMGSRS